MAPIENYVPLKGNSPMERKSAWLTRELRNSGCEVRFNTFTVGALREGNRVCGAILGRSPGRSSRPGGGLGRCERQRRPRRRRRAPRPAAGRKRSRRAGERPAPL